MDTSTGHVYRTPEGSSGDEMRRWLEQQLGRKLLPLSQAEAEQLQTMLPRDRIMWARKRVAQDGYNRNQRRATASADRSKAKQARNARKRQRRARRK